MDNKGSKSDSEKENISRSGDSNSEQANENLSDKANEAKSQVQLEPGIESGLESSKELTQPDAKTAPSTAEAAAVAASDSGSDKQKDSESTPVGESERIKANTVEDKPKQSSGANSESRKAKTSFFKILLLLLLLILIALVAGGAYYVYTSVYSLAAQQDKQVSLQSREIAAIDAKIMEQKQAQESERARYRRELDQTNKKLVAAENRLSAQNKRLLAMSTTSREDWLLAEAEYLLKLANQRVLIERSADSAIGLLEEADAILRDLADPDLFSLRAAIHDDLAALKLAEKIDIEGLYLQLSALAKQIDSLPLVPEAYNYSLDAKPSMEDTPEQDEVEKSFWRFFNHFDRYIRVIDHSDKPKAILPPEQTAYLHLNLRLMIERAQIALLREQQRVYKSSLLDAETWLDKYFPSAQATATFKNTIHELSQQNIQRSLPNISNSLNLLHGYIDTIHTLGSTQPQNLKPKNTTNSEAK